MFFFLVRCRWLDRGAIDLGWGECGLQKGAGCSGETPFGLAGQTLFFTGAPHAPEERPATHGACGAVRRKDWGARALIGGALEIIEGAQAPPKIYKVPPLGSIEYPLPGWLYWRCT